MEKVTRTENEHYSVAGIETNTAIGIIIMLLVLMAFSWSVLQELKDLNSIGQCVAEAKDPSETIHIHIERYGDCDPSALAEEARAAVLPKAETE